MKNTIGEKLSPVLAEIEETLWENEAKQIGRPNFPAEGGQGAFKIFSAVIMQGIYKNAEYIGMDIRDKIKMVESFSSDLRKITKKYANIDPRDFYS